jgi:hypothetical protein
MTEQKLEPDIVMLGAGASGGWIGSPKAKQVMLYFHGMNSVLPWSKGRGARLYWERERLSCV